MAISSPSQAIVWHGSQQESFDLVSAVARNCDCQFGMMGVRLATCSPHRMLMEDQRALNGLLFARRIADRLKAEEQTTEALHDQFDDEEFPLAA